MDAGLVPVYRSMTPAQRVAAGLSATDMIRDRLLESQDLTYALIGSIATMSYGEPRAALDIDVVVVLLDRVLEATGDE